MAPIPKIPRLDHWFQPQVQQALANLVSEIFTTEGSVIQDCLKVALSRIIIRVSNQESDTRYAAVQKSITYDQVYKEFLESTELVERTLVQTYGGFLSSRPVCRLINQSILEVVPSRSGGMSG